MDELLQTLDPSVSSALVGGGTVGAVNEITNWVVDDLRAWGLESTFGRFFPAIPFAVAFGLGLLQGFGLLAAGEYAVRIGLWSVFAKNVHRVTVKGA